MVTLLANFEINSDSSTAVLPPPIIITSSNIEIKAAKLNASDPAGFNDTLKTILNSNDSNPNSTKVKINDEFFQKLTNITKPSISLTSWNSNPHSEKDSSISINSNVISFEIKADQTTVELKNLTNPIQIQKNKKTKTDDITKKNVCKYWDKNSKTWSIDGATLHNETNTYIICDVTHLTDFGASQDLIVPTITIAHKDDEVWYTTEENFGIYTCVIYFVVFLIISVLAGYMKFSKYEAKITSKERKNHEADQTLDPINNSKGPDFFAKREEKKSNSVQEENQDNKSKRINNLSPLYAIYYSRNSGDCRRKIGGFVLYLMLVSMFLACLFSSPDLDVIIYFEF